MLNNDKHNTDSEGNLVSEKNIFSQLKKDHRNISELFNKLEDLNPEESDKKSEMFNYLKQELEIHSSLEETIFYLCLTTNPETKNTVRHSFHEHKEIRHLLYKLSDSVVNTHEWQKNLNMLKNIVEHHIIEEENELFPLVKSIMKNEQLKKLGKEFKSEREKFRAPVSIK